MSKSRIPSHDLINEPLLSFHYERDQDSSIHPLQGLKKYGPYSKSTVGDVYDPIRLALIVPHGTRGVISGLLDELREVQKPKERNKYLIKYPGFKSIFGVHLRAASPSTWIELPEALEEDIQSSEKPHLELATSIDKALAALNRQKASFDVLLIYLPERWKSCFEYKKKESENFDLHDYIKANTAQLGIPTQILLQDSAFTYHCRASVMWRLSIALYTKAGGVPWKLANVSPDTAFIGISYSLKKEKDQTTFVTCCSQVFDSDGSGLEFLTYETQDVNVESDNPFLNRRDMSNLMSRSLSLYQKRHNGRKPRRVVVHKSTDFKEEEIKGCFDALYSIEDVNLLHIQNLVNWKGTKIEQPKKGNKGFSAYYPLDRGTCVQLGGTEASLWTQGNINNFGGSNYFKEGKGIPNPLLVKRFAGHGSMLRDCEEILGLTKMDWNNDAIYTKLPVTMTYAQTLSRTIKRMPNLKANPYQVRFFM